MQEANAKAAAAASEAAELREGKAAADTAALAARKAQQVLDDAQTLTPLLLQMRGSAFFDCSVSDMQSAKYKPSPPCNVAL